MTYTIKIDNKIHHLNIETEEVSTGNNEVLAEREEHILGGTNWYSDGFTVKKLFKHSVFLDLKEKITNLVKLHVQEICQVKVGKNFELSRYHEFVENDDQHQKIIEKTRDLEFEDLNFPLCETVKSIENEAGVPLTPIFPRRHKALGKKTLLIVRINRPQSFDYNPPHKDGYLDLWKNAVNIWIPIAGVTNLTTLPIAPKSHLIPENEIWRSYGITTVNSRKFRVPAIVSWGDDSSLVRPSVPYGSGLVFSPLLIHGCASNEEKKLTRVALELRLFEKN